MVFNAIMVKANGSEWDIKEINNETHCILFISEGKSEKWEKNYIHKQIHKIETEWQWKYGKTDDYIIIHSPQDISRLIESKWISGLGADGINTNRKWIFIYLITLLLIFGLLIWGLIYGLNKLPDYLTGQVSIQTETEWGNNLYNQNIKSMVVDTHKTAVINQFYRSLNFPTQYPIQITVAVDSAINAYALPGGHIIVYTGILKIIKKPDELAALLGHEFTHINFRHSTRSLIRELGTMTLLSLLSGSLDGGELANTMVSLNGLRHDRMLETESDLNAIQLINQFTPLNSCGMVQLFQNMKKNIKGESSPQLLSSHPDLDERITHAMKHCKDRENTVTDSVWFEKMKELL